MLTKNVIKHKRLFIMMKKCYHREYLRTLENEYLQDNNEAKIRIFRKYISMCNDTLVDSSMFNAIEAEFDSPAVKAYLDKRILMLNR